MRKRILTRALVAALSVSLALGNTAPITTYAQETVSVQEEVAEDVQEDVAEVELPVQENQPETVTSQIAQRDVTLNQAGGEITEETILEWIATDGTYSLKYQFRTVDGEKEVVIKGYGANEANNGARATTIVIPSTISADSTYSNYADYQNVTVTSIDQNAFRTTDCPVSVTIPASVESIGTNAFTNGTSTSGATLKTLILEDGSQLTTIGDFAFQNQKYLAVDLVIPEGVTSIGESAFEGCAAVKSITFKGAGEIGEKAFYKCTAATGGIELPVGTTSIGDSAFYSYGSASGSAGTISLPEGLKSIGASAFQGASFKGNIEIPSTVETMGNSAFNGAFAETDANSTGTLTFAVGTDGTSKLTAIPNSAFYNC